MAIASISAFLILSPLFLAGFIHGDVFDTFADDVQNALPESDFSKLFNVHSNSVDDVIQALKDAVDTFCSILDTDVPDGLAQQFMDEAEKFRNLTPEQFLRVNAKTVADTLGAQGILSSANEQDLVESYVNELKDAAHELSDEEPVSKTYTALAKANANVMKSNGLSGLQLVVRNFSNIFLREIDNIGN